MFVCLFDTLMCCCLHQIQQTEVQGRPGIRVSISGLGISSSNGIQLEAKAPEQLLLTWPCPLGPDLGTGGDGTNSSCRSGDDSAGSVRQVFRQPPCSTEARSAGSKPVSRCRSQLLHLPAAVDSACARARFDVKRQRLMLELPLL
jgi:hypothetical protein